MIHLAI